MTQRPTKCRHNFWQQKMTRLVKFAISDSGAAAYFLVEGAPIINMREAENPITIKLPDVSLIYSTHIGNLDIPWMPDSMIVAHIVPGLSHSSLISTKVFCDAGCKVMFDEWEWKVYYKGELMLIGGHGRETGMWKFPINPVSRGNQYTTNPRLMYYCKDPEDNSTPPTTCTHYHSNNNNSNTCTSHSSIWQYRHQLQHLTMTNWRASH